MRLRFKLLVIICFLNLTIKAQLTITGKVINATTRFPVNGASVFLNNATKGTATGEEGQFKITNVKDGQYNLVVSFIGYETYTKPINVSAKLSPLLIPLIAKTVSLKEVIIYPASVRNRYLELFKRNFIGTSKNAMFCKIINPEILNFHYNKSNDLLEASTDEFLLIENKALGYRLKFLVDKFSLNQISSFSASVYFEGPVLFEMLDGSHARRKIWIKNRLNGYKGSNMHFFRSASSGVINAEGFIMHKLIRMPNVNRPPDDLIQSKILHYSTIKPSEPVRDSLQTWQRKSEMPKEIQYLLTDTLKGSDVIKQTDEQGIHALKFEDLLYIVYAGKKNEHLSAFYNHSVNALPYSIMSLQEEYAFFDDNGILANPQSITFEGYWSVVGKVADMLPSDYIPSN